MAGSVPFRTIHGQIFRNATIPFPVTQPTRSARRDRYEENMFTTSWKWITALLARLNECGRTGRRFRSGFRAIWRLNLDELETRIEPVTIVDVVDVAPDPRNSAVSSINVVFSGPINLSSFTFADLSLTRGGSPVTLTSTVTTALVSGSTYRINGLSGFTNVEGGYTLTVDASGIQDPGGNSGSGTDSDAWTMDTTKPFVVDVVDVTPDPRNAAVSTVDVLFSEPIVVSTFTYFGSMILRRDGTQVTLTNAITTSFVSGNMYRINGLDSFTTAPGTYDLSVNPAFIQDLAGNEGAGIGSATESWLTVAQVFVADVMDVAPDPRNTAVSTVDVVFSKPINPSTLTVADVSLTRNGNSVALDGSVTTNLLSGNSYRISGLEGFTATAGTYVLTVDASGVQDPGGVAGNSTVGSRSDTWVMDTTGPTVTDVVDVSPDPRNTAVATVDVVFSEPIDLSTFTSADVALTRDGNAIDLTGALTTTFVSGSTYRISGLGAFTSAEGSYTLTANGGVIQDLAGNLGSGSVSDTWLVDTTAPAAPAVTGITTDTGASSSDGITNDQTLLISGTADPGTTVTVFRGIFQIGTTTTNSSGLWTFDNTATTLSAGSYVYKARATDPAGNVSPDSPNFNVVIDRTAPATPAVSGVTSDTGASATDGITNDQTLFISGTAEAGSTVTVFRNSSQVGTTIASAGGAWTFDYTGTTLSAGTYVFMVRATDVAGNSSTASPNFTVVVDTSIPASAITAIATDTGVSATDGITSDATMVISGTAEANSIVTVVQDATAIGTTVATAAGTWSFDYTGMTLANGTYAFQVRASDLAGNAGPDSSVKTVVVDTVGPQVDNVVDVSPDPRVTSVSTVDITFSERIDPTTFTFADVSLTRDGNPVTLSTVVTTAWVSGTTFRIGGLDSFTAPAGTYVLSVSAAALKDLAGNLGTGSASDSWVLDRAVAPATFDYDYVADPAGRVITVSFPADLTVTAPWDRFRFDVNSTRPLTRDGSAMVGDVNGDGVGDMIVSDFNGDVTMYPGLVGEPDHFGHGRYLQFATANQTISPFLNPDDGAEWLSGDIGDLNGDGTKELIIGRTAYALTGDPSQPRLQKVFGFASNTFIELDPSPAVGDLNGDGKLDVLMTFTDQSTYVYWNTSTNGTISFATRQNLHTWSALAAKNRLVMGDLNGDGLLDLAAPAGIYFNTGTATSPAFNFTSPTAWVRSGGPSWGGNGTQPPRVYLKDGNGDGLLDVYFSNPSTPLIQVQYYQNVGTAQSPMFQYKAPVTVAGTPAELYYFDRTGASISGNQATISTVDFDGDGNTDITATGWQSLSSTTTIWGTSGPGGRTEFAYQDRLTYPDLTKVSNPPVDVIFQPKGLVGDWADTTGDGLPDLLGYFNTSFYGQSPLFYYPRSGTMPFSLAGSVDALKTTSGTTIEVSGVSLVDIDRDGYRDLVAGAANGQVLYYRNTATNGTYAFADPLPLTDAGGTPFSAGTNSWPIAIDLNGDGNLDFLVSGQDGFIRQIICATPGSVSGYVSGGLLGTDEHAPVNVTPNLFGGGNLAPPLATADVDHDGRMDVVMGDGEGRVWLLHNNGSGGQAHFSLGSLEIARTAAADLEIVNAHMVRLYFAVPVRPDAAISFHDVPSVAGPATGSAIFAPALNATVTPIAPDPRTTPVSSTTVTFSRPIDGATFSVADLGLTRNGSSVALSAAASVNLVSGTTYEIAGLDGFTAANGTYILAVNLAGIRDAFGIAGTGSAADSWIVDTTPPGVPAVTGVTSDTGPSATDGITSDQTLLVSGTAEAGSTVTVIRAGTVIGTTTASGSGAWSFDSTGTTLTAGTYAFKARATDPAGNTSADSTPLTVVVDTTAPAAPAVTGITTDTGASASDGITYDQTLLVSGTAEVGTTVTVLRGGTVIGSATANGSGAWSFNYTGTSLAAGTYQFTARATDLAGNVSADSVVFIVVVDLSVAAPAVTGVTTDTGASTTDGVTSDQTLVISGTAEANSTVTVLKSSTSIGTTTANSSGAWSFDHTGTVLAAGTYQFKARATDLAGNASVDSAAFTVVVDTAAPSAPAITGITTDTGVSTTDGITSDQTLVVSGTAEANSVVSLFKDGTGIGTTAASASGTWSFDYSGTTVPPGTYALIARATDLAGNVSGDSAAFAVVIDTSAPSPPAVTGITTDTGASATDGITSDQTLVISGTAEANSTVTVLKNGVSIGTTVASAAGVWSFNHTGTILSVGMYQFKARATDLAGNTGVDSAVFTAVVDTSVAAPAIIGISTDTGNSSTDGVTNDQTLVISGNAEARSTLTVFKDGTNIGTTTANGTGVWSFDYTSTVLAAGSYAFTARATDLAGNVSSDSAPFAVIIDTVAPPAPSVTGITTDTGPSSTDGITSDQTLIVSGMAEAGSRVTIVRDGNTIGTATANGTGAWSFDDSATTLLAGMYAFTARASDLAGNVSADAPEFTVIVDVTAPAAPTVMSISNDAGASATDGVTNDQTLIVSGTAEANSTVTVFRDGTSIGTVLATGSDTWTFDFTGTTLASGTYAFTARATDRAGNVSGTSAPFTVTVDTTAPSTPTITRTTTDTGASATDGVTNDQTLVISGTGDANGIVAVQKDGTTIGSAVADISGAWNFDFTGTVLDPGTYQFTALMMDLAGNVSPSANPFAVIVDTTAPTPPAVTGITEDTGASATDGITSDQTLMIAGTAEPGSTVTVFRDGASIGTTTATVLGAWSFDDTGTLLTPGTYAFSARSADRAGNVSVDSAMFAVVVVTSTPTPVISGITNDTGVSTADGVTNDQSLVLSGTAEPGSTVTVFQDGTSIGTTTVDGTGAWSFDDTGTSLPAGSYQFQASATNLAGITSATSAAFAVVVDTSVATPVVTAITTDTGASATDGVTSDQTLTVSGTADADSIVTVLLNGTVIGTTGVDVLGSWTLDYAGTTLPEGTYALQARAMDVAGNVSAESVAFSIVVDITPPSTTALLGVTSDTGASAADGITSDPTLVVTGTAEPNSTVSVFRDGTLLGTVAADGLGSWTFDNSSTVLLDGTYQLHAHATDLAGNVGSASAALTVVIDTLAPASPMVTGISTDTGASATDGVTSDQTLSIAGTAEPNATVRVFRDGVVIGMTAADASGTWSFDDTGSPLPAGTYAFTARATDEAGNTGSDSAPFTVVVDLVAPSVPVVAGVSTDTGTSATDGVTSDQTLMIVGMAEPGSAVAVFRDGVIIGTTTATATGSWEFDATGTTLAAGTYAFTARATDSAGNSSGDAAAFLVLIDPIAPVVDIVDVMPDPRSVSVSSVDIVFEEAVTGFDVADLDLRHAGGSNLLTGAQTLTTADHITWTLGNLEAITDGLGVYTLTVRATGSGIVDLAGNTLATDASDSWLVDNVAPILDISGDPVLTPIPRNVTGSTGDVIESMLGTSISDPDPSPVQGIAVVGTTGTGAWQFSLDSGVTWIDIGSDSPALARLIRDSDRVRFVPATGFVGTARLTYHAWDRTSGAPGGTADLSADIATGGSTAFSAASATATLKVAVTLAPVREDTRSPRGENTGSLIAAFIADPDAKARKGMAVVGVTGVDDGTWQYSINGGKSWRSLNAATAASARLLRDNDKVRFVPTANFHGRATIFYHAWDQAIGKAGDTVDLATPGATGAASPFSLARDLAFVLVGEVNDAPVLDRGGDPPLTRVAPGTANPDGDVVSTLLGSSTTDADGDALGMAITGATGNGTWQFRSAGASTWSTLGKPSAKSARLLGPTDLVRFVPAAGGGGVARLTYRAWDGTVGDAGTTAPIGGTAFSTASETGRLLVTTDPAGPANHAPVLDDTGSPSLPDQLEDVKPGGAAITNLLSTSVTDVDTDARSGIAVTGRTGSAHGTWQYSLDAGRSWKALGHVSLANALLLRDTDLVRYLPNRDFHGSATIAYHAWDQTRGSAGRRADLTAANALGGASSFSLAETMASVVVLPVNDAPVLAAKPTPRLAPITPGAINPPGDQIANVLGTAATDVDGDVIGMAVTGVTGTGTWQYQPLGMGSWIDLPTTLAADPALLGSSDRIRFVPAANFVGNAKLTYKAWDGVAVSRTAKSTSVLINAVDDRPVLDPIASTLLTPIAAGTTKPAGDRVTSLIANRSFDADPGAALGIAVLGATTLGGTWEVSTDGTNWSSLGRVAPGKPKVLHGTDWIRFVPDANFAGRAKFNFKIWDSASATPKGPLAFSTAVGEAVVIVNTAPELNV
jgi:Bacterial Ig-like domain/FG-GAP-like repeat/Bacterial Ig domain